MQVTIARRPILPNDHAEQYVVVPRTTQAVFELDPRTEPAPLAEAPEPANAEA
jgi:hypothetical protein